MIQDISPCRFDNHYTEIEPDETAYLMIGTENEVLLQQDKNGIFFPKFSDILNCNLKVVYLFSINEQRFFTSIDDSINLEELFSLGYSFHDVSVFRCGFPKWRCFAGATAYQLIRWYHSHQYCGICGKEMAHDTSERMMCCEHCGSHVYPQLCPAVIVGVIDNNNILMTQYSDQRDGTHYALIAGFAEIGETIEETVQREVMEEVGLRVKNIRYYKSQPWSFSDTLLFGFFCELDGSKHITLDTAELSTAAWIAREDMDIQDDGVSLTCEMMMHFKNHGLAF